MSWFEETANPSYRWAYRVPISVDATATQALKDVSVVLPVDWDLFWSTVRSAGEDVRVCTSDGKTLAVFDLEGFNATTRVCTLEIQNITPPAAGILTFWLYWGHATCATGKTTFAIGASPYTGYVNLAAPRSPIVVAGPERPGETKARQAIAKRSDEVQTIWFDFTHVLRDRAEPYGGHLEYEEINYATVDVSLADVQQAAMRTPANTRVHGRGWVAVEVKAGADATTYTVRCEVVTICGGQNPPRTLRAHQRLFVRNPVE